MTRTRNFTLVLSLLCAALAGCDKDPEPAKSADDVQDRGVSAGANTNLGDKDGDGAAGNENDDSSNVAIDERVRKMCNLPEARFDFDSANLSGQARSVLDQLATCFKTGPGKDHGMNIVGHADNRGDAEYNFALGQRRAGAVAGYLAKQGLNEDRVGTSSRGELESTGSDEAGWARDRRVEILLAD